MFINIEMDFDWTWGIDWYKEIKGIRLGCVAVHYFPIKHDKFMELYGEKYHQDKLKKMIENYESEEKKMTNHMKEHLIGKVVSDVEHIETDSMYGLTQSGMKISFVDGTSLTVNIEIDEELSDHPNLDWKIDLPQAIVPTE